MRTNTAHVDSQVSTASGNVIAYAAFGAPGGRPVYMFHGLPGSRMQAALFHEQSVEAGVQLVSFDRPGFGRSTGGQSSGLGEIAKSVQVVANHLQHGSFAVVGVSCGGPYALKAAELLGPRITAVGLLAGIGPMDDRESTQGRLAILRVLFGLAGVHPALAWPVLFPDQVMFRRNASQAVRVLARALPAADRLLLQTNERVARAFGDSLSEAYRQGIDGAAQDAHRIARYRVEDVPMVLQPVHIFQGTDDRHVPPSTADFHARSFPGSTVHVSDGEGHLSIAVNKFSECLARLGYA